jgi:hypothetical protein
VPHIADAVIVSAWTVVAVDNAVQAVRGATRERDFARWTAGAALVAIVVACGIAIERQSGGPPPTPALVTAIGVAIAVAGTLLHLGRAPRDGRGLVEPNQRRIGARRARPVRRVAHPLYVGLGLLAIGSIVAHPSRPVVIGGAEPARGPRAEDRARGARARRRVRPALGRLLPPRPALPAAAADGRGS